jgi:lipoprotein-anchoring transpeptidase ErfK/SrfK
MLTGSPVGHGAGVGSGGQRTAVRLGTLTLVAVAVLSLATPGRAQTVRDSATAPTLDSVTEAERRRLTGDTANLRLIIATPDRRLFLLQGADTVFAAPIGVGTGLSLSFGASTWRFSTPLGEWRVRRKILDPVWVPPDWHYAETAWNHRLLLVRLPRSGFTLRSGRRLEIRNNAVGIVFPDGEFAELPLDEHIVFEGTLFIPPLGTRNRRVEGNLGRYALDLGGGYLIHGTTDASSIGAASTHGCIRVSDDDLRWLFEHVPVGMRVLVR